MLRSITLSNFKLFKNQIEFPLSNLNLLTGINGRGKSSLIQSILLFKQSSEMNPYSNELYLNGPSATIGNYSDLKNIDKSITEPINIVFRFGGPAKDVSLHYFFLEGNDELAARLQALIYHCNNGFEFLQNTEYANCDNILVRSIDNEYIIDYRIRDKVLRAHKVSKNIAFKTFLLNSEVYPDLLSINSSVGKFLKIHYISADRISPKNFVSKINLGSFPTVGPRGEYVLNILNTFGQDFKINPILYRGSDSDTLLQQTSEWLDHIFDGARIEVKGKDRDSSVLSLLLNSKRNDHRFKASNVGFGYYIVLPIIVAGLMTRPGEMLIIENPEAHLHPKAQSRLSKFLALVSKCDVQVFIESHSEHFLNGLRVACADKDFNFTNKDLSVLYFTEESPNLFIEINVDENGGIGLWPKGFFDQADEDLQKLHGI